MNVGRSFEDMTKEEKKLNDFFNEKFQEVAKESFENGVDIGMFCSLAFTCAEKQYLKAKLKFS